MKYEEYVEKLEELDEDFEAGMLSQIKEEPPIEFHRDLIKVVKSNERKGYLYRYRKHALVVVAGLALFFALKGVSSFNYFSSKGELNTGTEKKQSVKKNKEVIKNDKFDYAVSDGKFIVNYEIFIKKDDEAVIKFINEKAIKVDKFRGIYSMDRYHYKKLEEILKKEGIEIKPIFNFEEDNVVIKININ